MSATCDTLRCLKLADLAGINFSDLKHCVMVLCMNTITHFVSVHTVVHVHA